MLWKSSRDELIMISQSPTALFTDKRIHDLAGPFDSNVVADEVEPESLEFVFVEWRLWT